MFHISRSNDVIAVVIFIIITQSFIFPFLEVISKCQTIVTIAIKAIEQ